MSRKDDRDLQQRVAELEQIAASQQETIEQLRDQSLLGQWGRRGVLGSIAVALGLASASGSAAAGVGDIGTASERVDVFGDEGDFNTLEAADRKTTVKKGDSLTTHQANAIAVSADSFETIFDLTAVVNVVTGSVIGKGAGRLRATYSDGTTEFIYASGYATGRDNNNDVIAFTSVPSISDVKKLEFKNEGPIQRNFGYRVITK